VSELEVWARPPSTLRNVDSGPPGGARAIGSEVGDVDGGTPGVLAVGPTAATTEVEDVDDGPPRGCCGYLRQRSPPVPIWDL
jgi:hypothetical protein